MKYLLLIFVFMNLGCNDVSRSNSQALTQKQNVDICKCLTEPGDSDYMVQNEAACNEAISREIGVSDWRKVNMKYDRTTSKRFDELVYRCTGQRPTAEISGTYSGTDNVGMQSTIVLRRNGTLVVYASVGDGIPDNGWWTGTADNLSLYHKDYMGSDELIGRAEVTDAGLQIIGGKFYSRQ
jgi:hypothetical protein